MKMHNEGDGQSGDGTSLGSKLRQIRETRGVTLRAVEDATGISNAYLSQLETGKIAKPSPHFLHKLAEFYGVPYELLMEEAGYMGRPRAAGQEKRRRLSAAALAAIDDLTPEEEEELMDFLAYLRTVRRKSRGSQAP